MQTASVHLQRTKNIFMFSAAFQQNDIDEMKAMCISESLEVYDGRFFDS
jgi:hypothetical protein